MFLIFSVGIQVLGGVCLGHSVKSNIVFSILSVFEITNKKNIVGLQNDPHKKSKE